MTTNSSGYVTLRDSVNSSCPCHLTWSMTVPPEATVFLRYKETVFPPLDIKVNYHFVRYEISTGRYSEQSMLLWWRPEHERSDFLHVFRATKLFLSLLSCSKTDSFQLFFSFFAPGTEPRRLASGLWNCSTRDFPILHPHLACNHRQECEEGQDETEHCPFSSPECQGLTAVCGRCYQFVERQTREKIDAEAYGSKYCGSLGATFSFPKCPYDWFETFVNVTKLHRKGLGGIETGFYSNDMSLPSMYRHMLLNYKTVLFHSFDIRSVWHRGLKECFYIRYHRFLQSRCTLEQGHNRLSCEHRENQTGQHSPHLQTVSFTTRLFPLPPSGQHSMTVCGRGHVTYAFFMCGSTQYVDCDQQEASPCDVSKEMSLYGKLHSAQHHTLTFPTYTCSDGSTLSYTLVCDFMDDCPDKSDESVCVYPVCLYSFTCDSGQCVSYDYVCEQLSHCYDGTDEKNCNPVTGVAIGFEYIPFPALITFDPVSNRFTSAPFHSNDSCPDSHYRCPGDFNDCLPVFTRCNGMYDCLDHQDEEGCEDLRCPGFFRCRVSTMCIHNDQLCDGWPHCPQRDDELVCDPPCPVDCLCQGHTFLCFQPFSATLFPQLRYVDATGSGMTLSDVNGHPRLFSLSLAECSLTLVPQLTLSNLRFLDLRGNQLHHFNVTSLLKLENLYMFSLSNNPLTSATMDDAAGLQQRTLVILDLSHTPLTVYDASVFSSFPKLQTLNLTSTSIHTISPGGFQLTQQLRELHMEGSPVQTFPPDLFKDLHHLRIIVTDNYKLCCDTFVSYAVNLVSCHAPHSDVSSCKDLLQSWTYRGFLWLIACLSVSGNAFCFCARFFANSRGSSKSFSVFVINLTMADFLMGVYSIIIGIGDEHYRGIYLHHDDTWRSSIACKVAGVSSLLSSEVSALVIWIITLDRFIVLHFPFSTLRFDRVSAVVACLLIWLLGWLLVCVPLLPVTSHWAFYGQTGICLPLPVTRGDFSGKWYSFSVLIVFNFVMFLFISAGQTLIYWSIQTSKLKSNTTKVSQDITIARRLITVAVTDFMCWFPIGMCGLLALAGTAIPGEVNVGLAIFVLPLNSALNPFIYTLNSLAEQRKKSREAKLLKWMESHTDLVTA